MKEALMNQGVRSKRYQLRLTIASSKQKTSIHDMVVFLKHRKECEDISADRNKTKVAQQWREG